MDRKCRGLFIGPLWMFALFTTTTAGTAAETLLGPDIVDPEFTHGRICWQDSVFKTSAVDMNSGTLAGAITSVDIEAAPISLSLNGPEMIFPPQGSAECIGTAMTGGVVRYNEAGGSLVPGTAERGLMAGFAPSEAFGCPSLRFTTRTADRHFYLWDENSTAPDQLEPMPFGGFYRRWLSCNEILVWDAPRYHIYRLEEGVAPVVTAVTNRDYEFGQSFPLTTTSGERLIIITEGTKADLYRDQGPAGGGWQLDRELTSPDANYPYFYSPEVFMWQNRPWLSGYIAKNTYQSRSKVFLYDINNNTWRVYGDNKTFYKDQETLPLDNGNLALYYLLPGEGTTAFKIVKP